MDFKLSVTVLCVMMTLDVFSGLIKAFVLKQASSKIGSEGLAKKASIIIILILSILCDYLLGFEVSVFRLLTCLYYIANEGLSVLENLAQIKLINIPETGRYNSPPLVSDFVLEVCYGWICE